MPANFVSFKKGNTVQSQLHSRIMKHLRVFAAYMGVMLMAVMPLMAQSYNIPFVPRAVAGGCSEDFQNQEFFINFDSADCTGTPDIVYTTSATEEHPFSQALVYKTNGSGVININSADAMTPDSECAARIESNGSGNSILYWEIPGTSINLTNMTTGRVGARFELFDVGLSSFHNIVLVGNGGPETWEVFHDSTDLWCKGRDTSNTVTINTIGDTGGGNSGCCGGSGCDAFLSVGTPHTIECKYGVNVQELWVDGCLVVADTQTLTAMGWASSERVRIGNNGDGDSNGYAVSLVAGGPSQDGPGGVTYHEAWVTNGCWKCSDGDTGKTCAE